MRREVRRSTGCMVSRFRKRWREWARREVKSGPKRSPRTYSGRYWSVFVDRGAVESVMEISAPILCLSGRGGTAQAGYSRESIL